MSHICRKCVCAQYVLRLIELQALSTRSKAPARVWAGDPGNFPLRATKSLSISTQQENHETSPWKSQNILERSWRIMEKLENLILSDSMRLDLRSRCEKPA